MSKRHPLWAIERPDGMIIQGSAVVVYSKDNAWTWACEMDSRAMKIYEKSVDYGASECLKKAGYKLVKVKAVKA